jgi:hypothetical protein
LPRSPSTYSLPPGTTPQQPNTVISSSMFNAFADDVAQTFNTVQPIAYGGTGSSDLKLNDTDFGIKDNSDPTKIGQFNASNLPTATTRTYDLPYYSGTLGLVSDIRGYRSGVEITTNVTDPTNDVDMAAGSAVDSTGVVSILLASALTKRVDATWVVGTNQGGRFYTTLVNGTIYLYLIRNPTTGVVDWGYSDNSSNPTAGASYPSGFTQYALIGFLTRASGVNGIPLWSDDRSQTGTWTPVAQGNTVAGTGTYSTQNGTFTKIGRAILFRANLVWSTHTGTGTIIVPLPFPSSLSVAGAASLVWDTLAYTSPPMARIDYVSPRIVILQAASNATFASIDMKNNVGIYISGHYEL